MSEAPMCVCGDKWHEHNAANHTPTCPVLDAFAALTQRAEAAEAAVEAVREQRDYWAIAAHKLADAMKVDEALRKVDDARENADTVNSPDKLDVRPSIHLDAALAVQSTTGERND